MKIEKWVINGRTLEYIEQTHTYIVDGVIVPSVTQILKTFFPAKYSGVNNGTLENASRKGTLLHGIIEEYETEGVTQRINRSRAKGKHITQEFKNYIYLKNKFNFAPVQNEIPIIYEDSNGHVLFAGRLDMVVLYDGVKCLVDIKRTNSLDIRYLRLQLNLYRLAYQKCYNTPILGLYALHLRDNNRAFRKIEINEAEALKALEIWKRRKHEGNCKT